MKPLESADKNCYDICVIGLGYVGLPTASILAAKGRKVLGVDIRQEVVDSCNKGVSHIDEPDLEIILRAAVHSGQLTAAIQPAASNVYIIAVPTPFLEDSANRKIPDMSLVEAGAKSFAHLLKSGDLVILESTCPVGTTEKVSGWINERRNELNLMALGDDLLLAHCPERILPGQLLKELIANDRICGGLTRRAADEAYEIYSLFCTGEISKTSAKVAELTKLVENAFRDVNIAFANELSLVCDKLQVDVWEVIRLANKHPRVRILKPGPGVGGHCIAVDPWFIIEAAQEITPLMAAARRVNDDKRMYIVDMVKRKANRFKSPVLACLGLTFKADVQDMRESPAYFIVKELAKAKVGKIAVVEPHINNLPAELSDFDDLELSDLTSAIERADIVVLLVDHRIFGKTRPLGIEQKVLIDTRGIWS